MQITLKQIEIFLAVANARSISAAARSLYISQPAVSSTIVEMEQKLGVGLFARSSRGVRLTADGQRFYAELDPIYKRFIIAATGVFNAKDACGTDALNIGAFHYPDTMHFMLAVAGKHRELYPECPVMTGYFNYFEVRNKLLCEELDMVFTFSFEVAGNPDLDCCRLRTLKQYFVVPKAYCDVDGSGFRYLRDKTLFLEVSSWRETMLNICGAHGFEPKNIKYVNSYLLLAQKIAEGEGFTIGGRSLPNLSALSPRIAFVPVIVEDCNEYVHIVAAWRQNDNRPKIRRLIELLKMPEVFDEAASIKETPGSSWYR